MKKTKTPADYRCVNCKWTFMIKRNGIFRERLVICADISISRVYISQNYSSVVNNKTIRLLLVLKIVYGFRAKIADLVTTFSRGD